MREKREELEATIEAALAERFPDVDLVDVEVRGQPAPTLTLFIDRSGGVDLDLCAAVSQSLEELRERYALEVSSPGLDRKLYSEADFERFAGRRVTVRMKPTYREHRLLSGVLKGLLDGGIVRLVVDNGQHVNLPYDEIFEARLEVDWNSIMKEGKTRS